jgi:hypothetical protein
VAALLSRKFLFPPKNKKKMTRPPKKNQPRGFESGNTQFFECWNCHWKPAPALDARMPERSLNLFTQTTTGTAHETGQAPKVRPVVSTARPMASKAMSMPALGLPVT